MLTWDPDWVVEKSRQAIPSLVGWSGFTWPWLWGLAAADPNLAQAIFEQLAEQSACLPGQTLDVGVELHEVGCLALDSRIVLRKHGKPEEPFNESRFAPSSSGLVAWRRAVWASIAMKAGLSLGVQPKYPDQTWSLPSTVVGYPIAEPLDMVVVNEQTDPMVGSFV